MTEGVARERVEAWLPVIADRLWIRQFRLGVTYEDAYPHNESGSKMVGRCIVDHDYGDVDITLYLKDIDDDDELFHILLHEACHAVVAEFWHVEKSIVPPALEHAGATVKTLVDASFRYAHERFVQRMMNIVLQQHPFPDAWAASD